MSKYEKVPGYVGHLTIKEGNVLESRGIEDPEAIKNIILENLKIGNEQANELGFNKLRAFIMIGGERSLIFMKNTALVVDNSKTDWHNVFLTYTFYKSWCVGGVISLFISFVLFYLVIFTNVFNWLAPEPRFYLPTLFLLLGIFGLAVSKTRLAYRLD
ncbi:MAG: hypothetical protein QXV69_04820 [Sulfolobaceae archaeon]